MSVSVDPAPGPTLRILGAVQLAVGPTGLMLSRLERGLLALAGLAGGLSADGVGEWLWGQEPPSSARNRVQALVSGVRRKAAPHGVLRTDGHGYRLEAAVDVDLRRWEEAVCRAQAARPSDPARSLACYDEALAVFRDEPLQGTPETPRVQLERGRLCQARLTTLEARHDAALAVGRLDGLVAALGALTAEHPYHEGFAAQYVLALAACGQQARALEVYRQTHRRLDDELGVEPSARLRDAQRRVLAGELPTDQVSTAARPSSGHGTTGATGIGPSRPHGASTATTADDRGIEAMLGTPGRSDGSHATLPVPRTLPRGPAGFIGRAAELSELLAAGEDSRQRPAVVAVTGLAGVGKSAVAIEAGQRLRNVFAGGTLYVDCAGEQAANGVHGITALFLRLLGVLPEAIPDDPAARAGMYRSLVHDRQILTVIDNLDSRTGELGGDLDQLLPTTAGSMAILTARAPVSGLDPTLRLRLRPLPEGDAVALLAQTAGRGLGDAEAVRCLARCAGGLPLALRLVGGRLAQRPDLTARRLARRLEDIARGLAELDVGPSETSLRASLTMAWNRLPAPTRHIAARLAALPVDTFSAWVPQALVDDEAVGDHAMGALIDASFVEPVAAPGRLVQYRLPDLVARFVREQEPLERAERLTALAAVGRRLLTDLTACHGTFPLQFLPPPGPGADGATTSPRSDQLAAEGLDAAESRERLLTELPLARSCATALAETHPSIAWRLLVVGGNACQISSEQDVWVSAVEEVLGHLVPDDGDHRLGSATLAVARAWHLQETRGQASAALALAVSARRELTLRGDLPVAIAGGLVAASAALALGRRDMVEDELRRVEEADRRVNDPVLTGWTHIVRGELHNDYDELADSASEFTRAREVLDRTGDRMGFALATVCLARAHRRQGRLRPARLLADEARMTFEEHGAEHLLTVALDASAEVAVDLGLGEQAHAEAEQAHARARAAQDPFLTARTARTLGRALRVLGRLDEAAEWLQRSVEAFAALNRDLSVAGTLRDLARVQDLSGQPAAASETLRLERAALGRAQAAAPLGSPPRSGIRTARHRVPAVTWP